MAAVVAPRHLNDYLLAHGRPFVTLADVAKLTGLTKAAATVALVRLRQAKQFFSPHPGLYVAVPAQYRTWGVVPGTDFIDVMMTTMRRRYYVALLSAAELHGAAHQRPQVFQVMVDRPVTDRDLERIHLRFYTHKKLADIPTEIRNTATGRVRIATPAVTCLDLATRPNTAGGLSNVATVVAELVAESGLGAEDILEIAFAYPPGSLRRLGWLLDHVDADLDTDVVNAMVTNAGGQTRVRRRATTLLDPAGPRRGHTESRWGIVENTDVEPDL